VKRVVALLSVISVLLVFVVVFFEQEKLKEAFLVACIGWSWGYSSF
jgi:hypothetical protein